MATTKELNELHARCDLLVKAVNKRDAQIELLMEANASLTNNMASLIARVQVLGALGAKVEALEKAPASNTNSVAANPRSEAQATGFLPNGPGRVIEPERGVTITRLSDKPPASVLPTDGEYRQLLRLVQCKHAQFGGDALSLPDFIAAFQFVGACGRYHQFSNRDWSGWMDDLGQWCRSNGQPRVENYAALGAAVIAWDDIDRTSLSEFPRRGDVKLIRHGGQKANPARWRAALESGRFSMTETSMPKQPEGTRVISFREPERPGDGMTRVTLEPQAW